MEFEALRNADFGPLDDAVDDWSAMVRDLATLKESAENGLRGAARKADWSGYNAVVSKDFIGRTAGEFRDAHAQADSIHKILRDTRNELKAYQGQLDSAIERGRRSDLTVVGNGNGLTVTANVPPEGGTPRDGEHLDEARRGEVTALRDEVQKILDRATESDESASTVLRAVADGSWYGFSDVHHADRDSGDRAVRTASELAALARKGPGDLTVEEFDRLDAGLKRYADDELFAARFAPRPWVRTAPSTSGPASTTPTAPRTWHTEGPTGSTTSRRTWASPSRRRRGTTATPWPTGSAG
ncbi:hypothetical protein AB0F77_19705 [Streptomyces sp. NPDC026672]|uniref:hypothetical protein n=1 Tax=unclassified Streptomyces TaxID=2593676 RepID=UPI00340512F4